MGLVRCDHCGWSNNPEGAAKCQKCNQDLVYLPPVPPAPAEVKVEKKSELSVSNCRKCGYPITPEISFCPNCGTPSAATPVPAANQAVNPAMKQTVRDMSAVMPQPADQAAPVSQPAPVHPSLNKTVRIGDTPRTNPRETPRDIPQPAPAEASREIPQAPADMVMKTNPDFTTFRLKPLDLNANETYAFGGDTDAAFEFADGQWFITDKSGTNSAYVCATRRIALQKGDVVLIGGRRYIFE